LYGGECVEVVGGDCRLPSPAWKTSATRRPISSLRTFIRVRISGSLVWGLRRPARCSWARGGPSQRTQSCGPSSRGHAPSRSERGVVPTLRCARIGSEPGSSVRRPRLLDRRVRPAAGLLSRDSQREPLPHLR